MNTKQTNSCLNIFRIPISIVIALFQWFVYKLHSAVNSEDIDAENKLFSVVSNEKRKLCDKNKVLEETVREIGCLEHELNNYLRRGARLLGIHTFRTEKKFYNPDSENWDRSKEIMVYYLYEKPKDSVFYLRGFVVGHSGYKDYIFRIDGEILNNESAIHRNMKISFVDTANEFGKLGIARQGFTYLKMIATEIAAKHIEGKMPSNKEERGDLHLFYEKMGFEVTFPKVGNPSFSMDF